MTSFFAVALGGAIGASARHGLGIAMLRLFGPGFPVGTLMANVFGGLLMGLLMGWLLKAGPEGPAWQFSRSADYGWQTYI